MPWNQNAMLAPDDMFPYEDFPDGYDDSPAAKEIVRQAPVPVHLITRWSGNAADETPLCGMDRWDVFVWGYRTADRNFATCRECLRRLE